MKNYFVNAYVRSRSSSFIDAHIRMMEMYVPYLKNGKLEYKEKSIEPEYRLKPHIFISNGR
jgi:hypothetical protein